MSGKIRLEREGRGRDRAGEGKGRRRRPLSRSLDALAGFDSFPVALLIFAQ